MRSSCETGLGGDEEGSIFRAGAAGLGGLEFALVIENTEGEKKGNL